MKHPILCLDFDGVIHSYTSGWKGADVIPDPPVPGAMKFLRDASQHFDVQIFSSRSHQAGGVQAMADYIVKHMAAWMLDEDARGDLSSRRADISAEEFLANELSFPLEKPPAMVTIDDRALTFSGNWADYDPQDLLNFKPWNKRT